MCQANNLYIDQLQLTWVIRSIFPLMRNIIWLCVILQVLRCQYITFYVSTSYATRTTHLKNRVIASYWTYQHTPHISKMSHCFLLYNPSLHHTLFLWKICRAEHWLTRVLNEKFSNNCLYQHVHAIPTSTDKLFYFPVYLLASFSRMLIQQTNPCA
jgi:hypothetical protein